MLTARHHNSEDTHHRSKTHNDCSSTQETKTQEAKHGIRRQGGDIQDQKYPIRDTSPGLGGVLAATPRHLRACWSSPYGWSGSTPTLPTSLTTLNEPDPTDGPFIINILDVDWTQPKLVRQQNTTYYSNDDELIFIGE